MVSKKALNIRVWGVKVLWPGSISEAEFPS